LVEGRANRDCRKLAEQPVDRGHLVTIAQWS
jgi:hypothetical protein